MRQRPESQRIHGTLRISVCRSLSVLVVLLAAQVFAPGWAPAQPSLVISEFVADNVYGLSDEDNDEEDWIEILNTTGSSINLAGWSLTDDASDLDKWRFPAVTLPAGGRIVVFASGKNRVDPARILHTSFQLSRAGEYLALVRPDGLTVEHEFSPAYPEQFPDHSYGYGQASGALLIAPGHTARYLIPSSDLGTAWRSRVFDDSAWTGGTTGVGYETQSGYEALIGTADVETAMYGVGATAYIRLAFNVSDPAKITKLLLRMKYDDGFAAFLNGMEVASANRPATLAWNSASSGNHPDSAAVVFVEYDISAFKSQLVTGNNILAIHGLNDGAGNSDFLILPELEAQETATGTGPVVYFATPTPGTTNGDGQAAPGPGLLAHGHAPASPLVSRDIVTTAAFGPRFAPVASVSMTYRLMFGAETQITMADDGTGADTAAGDGIYAAVIPGTSFVPGNMVRWFFSAQDDQGNTSRWPQPLDWVSTKQSAKYYGTVVQNPAVSSQLPIFQWFSENASAAHTRTGTRACVYWEGEFYDNVFARQRGGYTNCIAAQKFVFHKSHQLFVNEKLGRVKEINMNGEGVDTSYVKQPLAFQTFQAVGAAASESFLAWMRLNGAADRVAVLIEQVDDDFLARNGFDPKGSLYKFVQKSNSSINSPALNNWQGMDGVEKKLPEDETDTSDMAALQNGLNLATQAQRQIYVFDNLNLPQIMHYLSARVIIMDTDDVRKNFYMYRDRYGSGEWAMFPWDKDFTFGYPADCGIYATHPYLGDYAHRKPNADQWNVMYEVLFNTPVFREMFLRHLRTVMDAQLQPPGTAPDELKYEKRAAEIYNQASANLPSSAASPYAALLAHFPTRRNTLYVTHAAGSGIPDTVGIPTAQPAHPAIQFGTIEFFPASHNQDEEYVQLTNPNAYAVDISGWKLAGGVNHVFRPGAAIIAGGDLYVSPNVAAFRNRAASPKRGENRFVQGNYQGRLSDSGETLYLVADDGTTISQTTYAGLPALTQRYLRLTELHYDPLPPTTAELAVNPAFTASDFEFIELTNPTSPPVELQGLRFTNGVVFTFADSRLLQSGEYVLVVRNNAAFEARYGTALPVAGEYTGKLDNNGETVRIEDVADSTIVEFTYTDGRGWPVASQGAGHSMVPVASAVDAESSGSLDYCGNWRASAYAGGSPGAADPEIRDVVLNEIVAHTNIVQPPHDSNDQIEIYNTSSTLVSLNHWYLSDDKTNLKKWHIAEDFASIPANGRLLFDEIQNFHNPITSGFGIDKRGEQVYLSYLPGNSKDRVADAVRFKGQENGRSLSRFADGQQYWYATLPTPGAANSGPVADIVISELQYNPSEASEMTEFVELHNPTGWDINLFDVAGAWRLDGGVSYTFPAAVTIPAGGYAVVAPFDPATSFTELAAFRNAYGLGAGEPALLYGPCTGKLSNRTDRVAVERPQEEDVPGEGISWVIVDEAIYFDQAPWPPNADGEGLSLNRLADDFSGNAPDNWAAWIPNPGKSSGLLGVRLSSVAVPDGGRTDASPIAFTVSFSRAVNGFEMGDIVVTNGAVTVGSLSGQNGAAVYGFTVTPAAPGIVTVRIPENAALAVNDGQGNVNSPQFSFIFTQALTVALSSPIAEGGLTGASPVAFTVTFNQAVNGFEMGDIVVTNGAVTVGSLSGQNGAAVYGFTVTPVAPGIVTVRIPTNAARAVSCGEENAASPVFTFTYERTFTSPAATQMPWWLLGNE